MYTASTSVTVPARHGDDPLGKASTSAMHDSSIDGRNAGEQTMASQPHGGREMVPGEAPMQASYAAWAEANARGLAHSAAGVWPSAYAAFAEAARTLVITDDMASREALAVVHNNLAHASFRLGRGDEALLHAQRVHDVRITLAGGDAIAVARVRSDLAVMLSRTGRFAEAREVISAAIHGIERATSDEDERLIPLLETASRITIAAGQPSNAEPLLLRLHALLSEHRQSTTVAEELLARVARSRSKPNATPVRTTPMPFTPVMPLRPTPATPLRPTPATPLRPTPATPLRPTPVTPLRPTPVTPLRPTPVTPLRVVTTKAASSAADRDAAEPDTSPLAMIGFDFELADDPRKAPAPPIPTPPFSPLGFAVEYGTPEEPIIPNFDTLEPGPLLAPSMPTPLRGTKRDQRTPITLSTPTKGNHVVVPSIGVRTAAIGQTPLPTQHGDSPLEKPAEVTVDARGKARSGRAVAPRSSQGLVLAAAITAAVAAAAYIWLVLLPHG